MKTLTKKQFEALLEVGAISSVKAQGVEGGFLVLINGKALEARRGHMRRFKRLQAVASYLRDSGIGEFNVDVRQWHPEQSGVFE